MMKQALATRALVEVDLSGTLIRGTYHKPMDRSSESDLYASASGRTGVFIVNSLTTPRAGHGDSAVHWADVFARDGYPCFRFDLPGLGDTPSEMPVNTTLVAFITNGGYASMIGHILEELVERFQLDGVIVMGHCAGAVTALYAGSKQKLCRGLILMDPYFNSLRTITRVAPAMSIWLRRSRFAPLLRQFYDLARDLQRVLRRDGLPTSANRALLEQWRRVASRGLPILVLQAPSLSLGPGQFDYIRFAIKSAGHKAQITLELIPGTDHSFANLAGRQGVQHHARAWLAAQNLLNRHATGEDEVGLVSKSSKHSSQETSTSSRTGYLRAVICRRQYAGWTYRKQTEKCDR